MSAKPFTFRSWSSENEVRIGVQSFDSTDPTITVNGVTKSFATRVDVGTDDDGTGLSSVGTYPVAVYTWLLTMPSLPSDTEYAISITQGANTRTGSTRTQLSETDTADFHFFSITCDGRSAIGQDKGSWGYMRAFAESNKVTGIFHPDDHGYSNSFDVVNKSGNLRWIGQNPTKSVTTYAYAIAFAGYLGLIEDVASGQEILQYSWMNDNFSDDDRNWCWENIPMFVTPGDHELVNNAEENSPSLALIAVAKAAWLGTLAMCQPVINVANSTATRTKLGVVEVLSPDRVYGLQGNQVYSLPLQRPVNIAEDGATLGATEYQWLNDGQVSDIIGAVDTTSKFKVINMNMSITYPISKVGREALKAQPVPENWGAPTTGAQQPLHDYTLDAVTGESEWTKLMTLKSMGGVATHETADYKPVYVAWHGDTHRPYYNYLYQAEDALHAELGLYEFSVGSVNGTFMHGLWRGIDAGFQNYITDQDTYFNPIMSNTIMWIPDFTTRNVKYGITVDADLALGYEQGGSESTCVRTDMVLTDGLWSMIVNTIHCPKYETGLLGGENDDILNTNTTSEGNIISTVTMVENKTNAPKYLRYGTI